MTGHFHFTGNAWHTAKLTLDGEPLPYEIVGVRWHLNQNDLPVLSIDILPDQLTIETSNVFNDNEARAATTSE
jgi:hypothetical protein